MASQTIKSQRALEQVVEYYCFTFDSMTASNFVESKLYNHWISELLRLSQNHPQWLDTGKLKAKVERYRVKLAACRLQNAQEMRKAVQTYQAGQRMRIQERAQQIAARG